MPIIPSLIEDELLIDSAPIARGKERTCYLHPADATKVIKISIGTESVQSKREIDFYVMLQKRPRVDYSHLPRFYGTVQTNLGQGLVLDLVSDYDGNISKSLQWYLKNGIELSEAESHLRVLKDYLLENLIIFNHDMYSGNLLLQKTSADSSKLVIIDGLGDVVSIPWLNRFPSHVRSKIERRWKRFMKRYYNNPFVAGRKRPGARTDLGSSSW